MKNVRVGVIGTGGMGQYHLGYLNSVDGAEIGAVCDIEPGILKKMSERYQVQEFRNHRELLESGLVDAVIISTPHYDHTPIAIEAFKKGLHVLSEKPVAVHVKDAKAMEDAHKSSNCVYGVMFQLRTVPVYIKMKELIDSGELGEIVRVNYLVTDWFRTQAYYDSGGWRATWRGEGGGVLLNQCPHSLDLLQWFAGMPVKVTALCSIGKYHHIEVEDDVTAMLEYENGATGIFVTSTGEAPGTNLFEIAGSRGKLKLQDDKLSFYRTRMPVQEFCDTATGGFDRPETWEIDVPIPKSSKTPGHRQITENFINAILKGEKLIAPGEEGIRSLEIGNAIMMSGLQHKPVTLPLDGDGFEAMLNELIAKSKHQKKVKEIEDDDFTKSFHT
ncbi:Gfo/Idh/MocA family oxidoreductase [candidate division KSB1 bacterium]|nr:Gfo/Idh/MocA family oxidoreductase [candidate division KSB1 bacterium]